MLLGGAAGADCLSGLVLGPPLGSGMGLAGRRRPPGCLPALKVDHSDTRGKCMFSRENKLGWKVISLWERGDGGSFPLGKGSWKAGSRKGVGVRCGEAGPEPQQTPCVCAWLRSKGGPASRWHCPFQTLPCIAAPSSSLPPTFVPGSCCGLEVIPSRLEAELSLVGALAALPSLPSPHRMPGLWDRVPPLGQECGVFLL